jgi:hypothetical protein
MMSDDPNEERPWTEAQWEQLLRRSDARSAKYGELFETLRDHPDRERMIAHDMGWDIEAPMSPWSEDDLPDEEEEEESYSDMQLDDLPDNGLKALPAYQHAYQWGWNIYQVLDELLDSDEELDSDDPRSIVLSDGLTVSAKIAGGHGMGYSDDVLCGNIVYCRRGLEAVERSIAALKTILEQGQLPASRIQPLLDEGSRVRELLNQHIATLRARVWWQ